MNHLWVALTLLGLSGSPVGQAPQISVDVKDGEVVSTDKTFVVKVTAKNPVTQVEFYVGDDLRETDSSTPYEFHLDALSEAEGELTIKFSAYTNQGENASKTIKIRIDNGLTKGADFHVSHADELLAVSKWDDAIRASRVALKAQAGYNPARLRMARAYFGKGVYDQAQKYAEDALNSDSKYLEAADLLSAINLKRAFSTFHRSGEQMETLATIGVAMKAAVQNRKKILDAAVEKLEPRTDANAIAYADAAIRAGRFSAAIGALTDMFRRDTRQSNVANRLAYAQMRGGRFREATLTLNENNRQNGLDAYGWALRAVLSTLSGDFSASDDAMRQAVLSDSEDLGVRTAQAFLAIARNRNETLRQLATNLSKDEGQRSDVNYYLAVLNAKLGEFAGFRSAFERCVLAEPANFDMYIYRGNESLTQVAGGKLDSTQSSFHIASSRMYYETALEARPEAAEALTGLALAYSFDKKPLEAIKYARGAVAASPGYAAGQYVLSQVCLAVETELRASAEAILRTPKDGVLTTDQRERYRTLQEEAAKFGKEAQNANMAAGQLDKPNLEGRELPRNLDAYNYFARSGRIPLISAPK